MTQTPVFESVRARLGDPVTSHQAAASVDPVGSAAYVLQLLNKVGSATDDHLFLAAEEESAGRRARGEEVWTVQRLRTARKELQRLGLVMSTELARRTRTNRWAEIWVLTDAGRAAA